MAKPYGYELILDLHQCRVDGFTPTQIERFCEELCGIIGMNREDFHIWASDPEDYETDPPHLHGVSAVQFITTSSIVVHTITKMRQVYINLFSCKSFDIGDVTAFSQSFFCGVTASSHFIERL